MRLLLAVALALTATLNLSAQTCVPAALLPAGQGNGTLSASSCSLSDGTPYDAYRLTLPGRGQVQIGLNPPVTGLSLMLQDSTGAQIASGASIQRQVESGSYTVLVNGLTPASGWQAPAPYTLQTAFNPEPGTWCNNFTAIGVSQSVSGALGAAGCQAPDGTPYDALSLSTLGAGTLTVTVASTDFTPVLTVRGSDGTALATDPASVSIPVTSFSQYLVVVASADHAGSYEVTTSFQPASGETCVPQSAVLAAPSAADNNAIAATSCAMVIDDAGDAASFNYYNLAVASAGLADIAVGSTDFSPTLNLLDAAGNTLASDSAGGGFAAATGTHSEIRMYLAPGSYTVQVLSSIGSTGKYSLNYGFAAGAPSPCSPMAYAPGPSFSGTLSPASCRTALGLADIYSLNLPASGTLSLQMTAATFPSQVAIRDSKDNLIVMNQDLEGLGASQLTATLPAGSYTILASANSGSGAYVLSGSFQPVPIAPCNQNLPLGLNSGYLQIFGLGSCTGSNGQPVDLYQFTMPSAGVAAVVMTSSEVTGSLTLTDSNGNFLRSDLNSYAPNDPFIVQYLPAGTYRLWASSLNNAVGGQYLMSLLANLGARPAFCSTLGPLAVGTTASGTLGIGSCQYIDNTFVDVYQVTLTDTTTIDLELDSAAFDAYLTLLDGKGNLLAQDDDSGGGTNARIVQQLAAGTYYVLAKQFGGYYPAGAYTLSLTADP